MVTREEAEKWLPTKSVVVRAKPEKLKYLIIAPPKWGKTTFFTGRPNVLLMAFEEGHSFAECPKLIITAWDRTSRERGQGVGVDDDGLVYVSAMEAVEALENHCPYDLVVIDTLDMASKMCTDHHLKAANLTHPQDGGDYGKGYDIYQTAPFRRFFNRVVKLGVGVACTTHVEEKLRKDRRTGVERVTRETTLPGGIQKFIHTQSDIILNGRFDDDLRRKQKARYRFLSLDGSNDTLAGSRARGVRLPLEYVVAAPTESQPAAPWVQWESFFKDSPSAAIAAEQEFKRVVSGQGAGTEPETLSTETLNKNQ